MNILKKYHLRFYSLLQMYQNDAVLLHCQVFCYFCSAQVHIFINPQLYTIFSRLCSRVTFFSTFQLYAFSQKSSKYRPYLSVVLPGNWYSPTSKWLGLRSYQEDSVRQFYSQSIFLHSCLRFDVFAAFQVDTLLAAFLARPIYYRFTVSTTSSTFLESLFFLNWIQNVTLCTLA